jgi:hypothetical protein
MNSIEDDANPVAVLWDLWTNARYGLGLPESRFNLPSWMPWRRRWSPKGWACRPSSPGR